MRNLSLLDMQNNPVTNKEGDHGSVIKEAVLSDVTMRRLVVGVVKFGGKDTGAVKAGRNFGPSNEGGGERDKLVIVDWREKKKMRNGVVQVLIVRRDKSTTVFCFGRRPYACPCPYGPTLRFSASGAVFIRTRESKSMPGTYVQYMYE